MITNKDLEKSVPEGMEVVGEKILCDKHGDITQASIRLPYTVYEDGKPVLYKQFICLQCLSEVLAKLQEDGKMGKLQLEREIATHEDAAKMRESQAKMLEKMKAEKEAADAKAAEENKETSETNSNVVAMPTQEETK
jgi:hypothetical protein